MEDFVFIAVAVMIGFLGLYMAYIGRQIAA